MANRVSYLKISTPFEKIFCGDAKERKTIKGKLPWLAWEVSLRFIHFIVLITLCHIENS